MKKAVSKVLNIPERIRMFTQCANFYSQIQAHSFFVDAVMEGDKKLIGSWNDLEVRQITDLALKFGKSDKQHEPHVKLWNAIFERLIELPKDEESAVSEYDEKKKELKDEENDNSQYIENEDNKDEMKHENIESKDETGKSLMNHLE
eukprot:554609_1